MSKPEFCRTCFSSSNLSAIFNDGVCENFAQDLFITTGIKIERNDTLSQLMCAKCINFIEQSITFREKCEETNKKLLKLLNNAEEHEIEVQVNDNSLLVKLDTDDYVEMEGSFSEFMENAKDVIFTNAKKPRKADLSFIKMDEAQEENNSNQCLYCPKVFKKKSALTQHQRIHTDVKAICQYCGKAVRNERALLVHYKAMHGYEKTDKCRFCDYRGTRPDLVKIHERTHTGEKPYVCEECGAGFHRKSSYLTHMPLHLPEKTVQCDECPAMFKSVTLMHIHKSNSHRRRAKAMSNVDNIWNK